MTSYWIVILLGLVTEIQVCNQRQQHLLLFFVYLLKSKISFTNFLHTFLDEVKASTLAFFSLHDVNYTLGKGEMTTLEMFTSSCRL